MSEVRKNLGKFWESRSEPSYDQQNTEIETAEPVASLSGWKVEAAEPNDGNVAADLGIKWKLH